MLAVIQHGSCGPLGFYRDLFSAKGKNEYIQHGCTNKNSNAKKHIKGIQNTTWNNNLQILDASEKENDYNKQKK